MTGSAVSRYWKSFLYIRGPHGGLGWAFVRFRRVLSLSRVIRACHRIKIREPRQRFCIAYYFEVILSAFIYSWITQIQIPPSTSITKNTELTFRQQDQQSHSSSQPLPPASMMMPHVDSVQEVPWLGLSAASVALLACVLAVARSKL
jgi:hypothetical protein